MLVRGYLNFSFPSTFVPGSEKCTERTFVSVELSFRGIFAPWNFRPMWNFRSSGATVPKTFAPNVKNVQNDLDTGLSSKILKFADDTKIFRPVMNHTDGLGLQQDL